MFRRQFFKAAAANLLMGAWVLANATAPALAQTDKWPDRPVKLIVPYAPGGATDTTARPWADKLTQAFGQQFVIENRGGASGMIGAEAASKSPPDGYTLLYTPNAPLSVVPSLRKTAYDPLKSFDPIGRTGDAVVGFAIHPSVGVKTFQELIDYAKKNPGKLIFGSSGVGTGNHLRLESLKMKAGIDILHVPYRGGADSLNDLLPGTVHLMNEPIVLPHVKAGKLILLNINGPNRHPDFPDVPTTTELGMPEAEVPIWFSIFAPAGTPKEIISRLNAKMIEIAKTDDMKAKMLQANVIVPQQTPEQMTEFLKDDIRRNLEVIKATNIKID
jgi:tripartite-type tricarboxylate transporter receptor subunit TctC